MSITTGSDARWIRVGDDGVGHHCQVKNLSPPVLIVVITTRFNGHSLLELAVIAAHHRIFISN